MVQGASYTLNCKVTGEDEVVGEAANSMGSVIDSAIRASVFSVTMPTRGTSPRFIEATPAITVDTSNTVHSYDGDFDPVMASLSRA